MFIYKITNKINNKIYIGLTTRTIHKRWVQHLYDCNTKRVNSYLYKAIRKYGEENFFVEKICECNSIDDLKKAEKKYILEYNTFFPNGYNLTTGGDCPIISNSTKKKLKAFGKTPNQVARCIKASKIAKEVNKKIVIARHIVSGIEMSFNSRREAKKYGFFPNNISVAIRTKQPYKEHFWRNIEDSFEFHKIKERKTTAIPVKALNEETNELYFFKSAREAEKCGFNYKCISLVVRNKIKSHKKFVFSKITKEEYDKNKHLKPVGLVNGSD